jgi:DNA-binding NtrC family response regulator
MMNDRTDAATLSSLRETEAGANGYRILLLEDDRLMLEGLTMTLERAGFEVEAFEYARNALERLPEFKPDVVLTDLFLSDKDAVNGIGVLDQIRASDDDLPVVLMTARGNIPAAIEAIRKGAYDFLEKPFDKDRLLGLLKRAAEQRRLAVENRTLREQLAFTSGIDRILLGQSPAMRSLSQMILLVAPTPANVIILGETGSGKEMVARCIHEFSRRPGRFVPINCAAIPENLFESELFGHEAGAYTGAAKQRVGKIEYANGGTLFLDEIEAMPLHLQSKLLRVIQERQVDRLGSNKTIPVDLRVVAATKVDLKEHSRQEKFRIDLYYRLNVASLQIPALRERMEDVPLLFTHFVQEAALRMGKPALAPTLEILQQLRGYDWPGNVRELRNAAEQYQFGLPVAIGTPAETVPQALDDLVAVFEKSVIAETLRRHQGAAVSACNELKINYTTLYRKMKAYGMDLSRYK